MLLKTNFYHLLHLADLLPPAVEEGTRKSSSVTPPLYFLYDLLLDTPSPRFKYRGRKWRPPEEARGEAKARGPTPRRPPSTGGEEKKTN